jgi:tetratricopeptide (TPR) repeat protein
MKRWIVMIALWRLLICMNTGTGDVARWGNDVSEASGGNIVQSGSVHGDINFYTATSRTLAVPRQLPLAVRHFVNRAVEQDALTALLIAEKTEGVVLISAIDGPAGVGKSTLAVNWAHRMRDRFPHGELYINLRGFDPAADPMPPDVALTTFLVALDVPAERIPADVDAQAALFRSLLYGRRMLLLLDNARSTEQVRPLLPASPACLVLVTSRNRLDDLVIREGATRMTLEMLAPSEARDMLSRYIGSERVAAEPEAVTELIEQCARLPLALGIVAVRAAANPDFPLEVLATELRDELERLDALETGEGAGVRAVFSWSYRSLPDSTARLFRLLSLSTGPDFDLAATAALAGISQREARTHLGELTRAHLLEQHVPGRYRFHDLLRAYAAECASEGETIEAREAAIRRLLDLYLRTSHGVAGRFRSLTHDFVPELPPSDIVGLTFEDDERALNWWGAEMPCLIAATQRASMLSLHTHAWQLSYTVAYFFQLRGNTDDLVRVCETGLRSARELGDRAAEAHLLESLSNACFFRGQYLLSIHYSEQALPIFREMDDRSWEGSTLIGLGLVYLYLRRYDEALNRLRQGLELMRDLQDRNGLGYAHAILGLLHSKMERFEEAFDYLREALRLYREVGQQNGEAFGLNYLGDAYVGAGRMEEAVSTYRQAVEYARTVGHRRGEARGLRGLGMTSWTTGDSDKARDYWRQALAIFDELGSPEGDEVRTQLASQK